MDDKFLDRFLFFVCSKRFNAASLFALISAAVHWAAVGLSELLLVWTFAEELTARLSDEDSSWFQSLCVAACVAVLLLTQVPRVESNVISLASCTTRSIGNELAKSSSNSSESWVSGTCATLPSSIFPSSSNKSSSSSSSPQMVVRLLLLEICRQGASSWVLRPFLSYADWLITGDEACLSTR